MLRLLFRWIFGEWNPPISVREKKVYNSFYAPKPHRGFRPKRVKYRKRETNGLYDDI